jgi:hypothetical protein
MLKMQRAAADDGVAAAAAAAAEKVAPLLQLQRAAEHASTLGRTARTLELYERAVAAAEAALPRDSLITANCLTDARRIRNRQGIAAVHGGRGPLTFDVLKAAWSGGERIQVLSQQCLLICHDRWRAGTLLTPTPEEIAFFAGSAMAAPLQGAVLFWACANDVAAMWPPAHARAESEARLHAIYDSLRAALEVVSRGLLHGGATPADAQMTRDPFARAAAIREGFLLVVLRGAGGLPQQLHRVCGLSRAEEEALRRMVDWNQVATRSSQLLLASLAEQQQRADADVARHGLRACALPECAQTEPHPKAFKVCGRCRAVVYCSAAHQAEDWRRHKREDGCKAAST